MKRLLFLIGVSALVGVLWGASVLAQEIKPPLYQHIDFAVTGGNQVVIGGWNIDQNTGHHAVSLTVYRVQTAGGGQPVQVPTQVSWGSRPDVAVFFHSGDCILGFGVVTPPQPSGDWTYLLLFADAPFAQEAALLSQRVVVR